MPMRFLREKIGLGLQANNGKRLEYEGWPQNFHLRRIGNVQTGANSGDAEETGQYAEAGSLFRLLRKLEGRVYGAIYCVPIGKFHWSELRF